MSRARVSSWFGLGVPQGSRKRWVRSAMTSSGTPVCRTYCAWDPQVVPRGFTSERTSWRLPSFSQTRYGGWSLGAASAGGEHCACGCVPCRRRPRRGRRARALAPSPVLRAPVLRWELAAMCGIDRPRSRTLRPLRLAQLAPSVHRTLLGVPRLAGTNVRGPASLRLPEDLVSPVGEIA